MPDDSADDARVLHRSLGLTDDEAAQIHAILGRRPNGLELAMYAVMWSEHCSYKSSRLHLKRLPTDGPHVLVGPGENAGVVDVGHGIAAAIRIESHNHPSAIEPYQGAATGVGGILRDIFTMGARPVAVMDPLRFGPLDDPRSRWIAEGVVAGISGYGNAVGVPTVGGEVVFDPTYAGNPLVNVLCLGLLPQERLVLGRASGVGNLAVLIGSTTGRDGIGGVSVLASAGFSEDDSEKRPSVQVGDPYEEKRLIEACLALLDEGLVVGIQDLGGAGLTCATSETASRGGVGMDVDVSAVPCREPGMEPFEIMTSESQERMLAIVEPVSLQRVLDICERWEVRATVVGRVTEGGSLRIRDGFDGPVLAEVPAASLHDAAPCYDRPRSPRPRPAMGEVAIPVDADAGADLLGLLMDTSWISRQYDHQLFCNTVCVPGQSDAAVLRLVHPVTQDETGIGLALTTDGNHRWCAADPRQGTAMIVAESVLNLACVGARPLALVNCLNFGNPEHPEVMWELSEAIDGMADACRTFELPVVGGNVSLYNETRGADIAPTPVVGVLGIIDELSAVPPGLAWRSGDTAWLIGPSSEDLGASAWAQAHGGGGALPPLDPDAHSRVAAALRELAASGLAAAAHDVASGGVAVALAEMAIAGRAGLVSPVPASLGALFSEASSRAVVTTAPEQRAEVLDLLERHGVPAVDLGTVEGDRLVLGELVDLTLDELTAGWRDRLPAALGSGTVSG
ncbi:MAG: phosphoribosylformylglycinamidine synthase subunit PurL [Acidimicrobiales bacterium]|nr:phosphoribosylformylglycinamidine synthase subunit PurL [Acidimicrobiales bacterium]